MSEFDAKELRAAFGSYMTGVTVVTAKADYGSHVGFTANSFTSVSLDPPLLLVCPGNHLSSFDVFKKAQHFAVNILAEDQEAISNLFASSKVDRFAQTDWSEDRFGSPIIDGVAASFSCSTHQQIDAGDHIILLGEVRAFENNPAKGLGYSSSGYFNLNPQYNIAGERTEPVIAFAGALIVCGDQVLVKEVDGKYELPVVESTDPYRDPSAIGQWLTDRGLDVEIRQTYSVFDAPVTNEHFTYYRATARSLDGESVGKFVPIETLDAERMAQPGATSMMRRFKSEFSNQQFGLFIGNADSGDVHPPPKN